MPSPSDPDAHYALEIIKANARILYGRQQTYDIVISQPKYPGQSLGVPKYEGQKIHALLIAYTNEEDGRKGKLLRGAFTMGIRKSEPRVGEAIQLLHEEVAADVEGLLEGLIREPSFEGGLIERRRAARGPEMGEGMGKGKGKGKEKDEGGTEVDDDIDGLTLRGD
ncbi:hypothetical protein EK21DRAFT_93160 [Setomelanomma holmii]|uniref:Uncharacterized protein n=1 Tax=Setomelanomma holmii TaxID=210430 RepID=A0A9P4LHJ3_9PLEO|nr:hypothetical protein EK21DRAFT_93160 [Setomelanomma holmii]